MTISSKVICSTPGKVLICGGYLVLDQAYSGIVCALDARFHVEIHEEQPTSGDNLVFEVHSPQFTDGYWKYEYNYSSDHLFSSGTNTFLQTVLKYTLKYISGKKSLCPAKFIVVVQADNDFYSQLEYLETAELPVNLDSLKSIPKFNKSNCSITNVHKTGLGSSAALVSALVSSLLLHFRVVQVYNNEIGKEELEKIEHLAQCKTVVDFRLPLLGAGWDSVVSEFKLPPGVILQLGDVNCGSNTPKMVSKVLDWRLKNPEASKAAWDEISHYNKVVISEFKALVEIELNYKKEYYEVIQTVSAIIPAKWCSCADTHGMIASLLLIRSAFVKIRKLLKEMGELAKVQIEPDQQTDLLNKSMEIEGVLASGVPGAGGYDAIFCLIIGQSSRTKLLDFWSSQEGVTPLLASQSDGGLQFEFM
ncbi:phosphomevalonate kinase [Boothiomyces sp. JEL0866]|nr:phosphomevalonate kinase [Boothiomyces sp. JEL0866]